MNYLQTSLLAATFLLGATMAATAADPTSPETILLGKNLFFDSSLSANGTQSCAACHAPEVGFTGPDATVNMGGAVYEGALPNHYGNRKPPTSAYAGDSPVLAYNETSKEWSGGMFWDGRATGAVLGDPLAEQAQGPYLNPLEQSLANSQVLCVKVRKSGYAALFEEVWGTGSLDCAKNSDGVYEKIARSVAAYERSSEVNPFTSKFDLFWDNALSAGKDVTKIKCGTGGMGGGGMGGGMMCSGGGTNGWASYRNLGLTDNELQGLAVFNDPNRANCAQCHVLKPLKEGERPLFTNFGYDNLGIPKHPDNPFYSMPKNWNPDGKHWIDFGLGGYLKSAGNVPEVYEPEMGKHKVPTLRNVNLRPSADFVKSYGHNGYFKSLEDIIFFYRWRAMMDSVCGSGGMGGGMGGCESMANMFPAPEVEQNRATLKMFNMMDQSYLLAFIKTLSDGYFQR